METLCNLLHLFFFLTSQIGKLTAVANKTWALSSRNGTLCRRDRTGQNRGERKKREGGEAFCDWTVTRKGRREPLGRTRMEAIQLVRNRFCCRSYRCINTKRDFAPASAVLSTVESKFTQKYISKNTVRARHESLRETQFFFFSPRASKPFPGSHSRPK